MHPDPERTYNPIPRMYVFVWVCVVDPRNPKSWVREEGAGI